MSHRSHPRLNTRSRPTAKSGTPTEEITRSLVEEYLADRITVTEMCNRLDFHLNRFKDDWAEEWLVAPEEPLSSFASVERCLLTRNGNSGLDATGCRLLFHPGWSKGLDEEVSTYRHTECQVTQNTFHQVPEKDCWEL